MKKKLLLTSVAALTLFAAYNTASADVTSDGSVAGKVNPKTGLIDKTPYTTNEHPSFHHEVPAADQYKPATPAYNPYHGKPVVFGNGSHVRFHVRDIQGNPVAGVKVDILPYKLVDVKEGKPVYAVQPATSAVSNEAGDVELSVNAGDAVRYRVAYVPKGYVVRQAKLVKVDGKDTTNYTLTGYRGEYENLANGETHEDAGAASEGTFVVSGSAHLNYDVNKKYGEKNVADMFTNASVDLVLEKTDSYNVVKDQWVQEEDGWKYYASNKAVTGWKQVDGKWYFFNAEGVSQKWWVKDNGTWYYLNGSGEMQTGWLQDNGTWYYLEASGAMKASQWFEVDGKWYYVDATGALAVNTTVDGYTVNANGEWV